ncbi:DUF6318 family protein [Nocardioides sp. SYSU D00038]|uniref:DUF6318 family protein n=1 Tax=Nocardioides sp. SYSU D00038 TaxID=2812554 RepID=UPI001967C6FE|nr:DUF6318 family protein [Nocardioides sp. SYSU D00038]
MRRLAPLCALLLVLAAGCAGNDDPGPRVEPTPSATDVAASPSASPTPAALSPVETVEAWVAARNEALRTGEVSAMEQLSAPECRGCPNLSRPIASAIAAGGQFEGGRWTIAGMRRRDMTDQKATIDAGIRIAAGVTTQSQGAEPVSYPKESRLMVFELRSVGSRWLLTLVAFAS